MGTESSHLECINTNESILSPHHTDESKIMDRNENPSSLLPPHHTTIRSANLSHISSSNNAMHMTSEGGSLTPKSDQKPSQCLSLTSLPSLSLKQSLSLKRSASCHHKRESSILMVNNGVTGKYISSRICKIAARFWLDNIDNLSISDQLEIGCSIFFGMLSTNAQMKRVMKSNFAEQQKIEHLSLRYLGMMGWLIRYLITDNVDLYYLLSQLGALHRRMGISIQCFDPMLQSMHQTFAYYFEAKYNISVKYSLDEIFSLAAQLMTGENLNGHLNDITQQFQGNEIPFLKDLHVCLGSSIGKEYLYRFLGQTWCEEIAIFLQSMFRFKGLMTNTQRYFIAKEIVQTSISSTATFSLNISYETRINIINDMSKLEQNFVKKESFEISAEFFSEVEREIYRLLKQNHWHKFTEEIKKLQSKSFNVNSY